MNSVVKRIMHLLFGLSIFSTLGYLIYYIIFVDDKEKQYQEIFQRFCTLNDAFTSSLVLFGFLFALFIYLVNQKVLPSKNILWIIENIPDFLPFKHSIKNYFKQFIKKEYKIIVLLRTIDEKNYEWVLNQISAYNTIMNNNHQLSSKKTDIEFLFVNKYTDEIKTLIHELNTNQYNYILISSLSAIFKDAILARKELSEEKKINIQIIGALSSINDSEIQKIINNDDNIIRVFPPDYDEAKTAMEFLFSKVKNCICANENCDFHGQKNNIIIIHNGTYGRAVRNQCEFYFKDEFEKINLNTSNAISATELKSSIQFHSFDYTSHEKLLCDETKSESFESRLKEWSDAENYFYIIGYEPNISHILEHLNEKLEQNPKLKFSLLFSGTSSMNTWKNSIKKTLKKLSNLKNSLPQNCYHLNLDSVNKINSSKPMDRLNLSIKHYLINKENREANIYEEMTEIFKNKKHIYEVENIMESFWKDKKNYITTFTTDSIHIALYAIEHDSNLLISKYNVLKNHGRKTEILVNGDSINQYRVKKLN